MKKIGLCISGILMSTCFGMDPAQIKSLEDKRTGIQAQLDSLNEVLRLMHEDTYLISTEISRNEQTIKAFEAELADLKKQKKEKAEEFDKKRIILAQEMKEFEDIIGVSQADQKTIDDLSKLFPKTSSTPNSNKKLSSKQQIINLQKKYNELKDQWQLLIDWNQDVITFLSQGKMSERFHRLNSMKPKVNKENNSASTAAPQPTPLLSKSSTVPQPGEMTPGGFIPQPNKISSAMPVGFILFPIDQNTSMPGDGMTPPLSSMLNETANTMREFNNTLASKLPNRMFSFLHHINQLLGSKLGPDIAREFHNIFMKSIFLNHPFETKELSIEVPIIESSSDQTIFDIVSSVLLATMSSKETDLIQKMGKKLHVRHERGQSQLTMSSILRQSKYSGYGFNFLKEKGLEILSNIQIKAPKELSAELLKFLIDSNIKSSNSVPVDLTKDDPLFEPLSFVLIDLVKTMFINSDEVATEVMESIPLPIDVLPPEDCDYIAHQIYNKIFAHSFAFFIGRCPMTVSVDRMLFSLTPQSLRVDFKNLPNKSNFRKSKVQIGFPMPSVESFASQFWDSLPGSEALQKNMSLLSEVSTWKTDRLEQRKKVSAAQQKSINKLEEERSSLAKEIENLEKQWQKADEQMKKLQADSKILFKQKSEIEDKYPNPTTIQNQSRYFSKQISSLNKQIEKLLKSEGK